MFIKEVILEGFKSYAQRTVISGFDPHFNAITGLNGSGKSNILDAICFVFGITNLSLVRVEDLKGIVYKKGQGRTKRATVTIVFDNKDKANGPDAYEQFSEITVTRHVTITQGGTKNKYLINGHLAQPTAVKNLFHSVGLNVNNPHFLIMQGRITKIVKMKPIEILGLLEESAGTKMFEMKKENAIKTIEKKQLKVDEFSSVIKEEIAPKLEKLAAEQKNYIQWTSNNKEIESLKKLSIAYSYLEEEKRFAALQQEKEEQEKVINNLKDQQTSLKKKIKETQKQYDDLVKKKDLEAEGEIQHLEKAISAISKQLVKLNSDWNHAKESLEKDQKNKAAIEKAISDLQSSIEKKQNTLKSLDETFKQLEKEAEHENHQLNEKKRQYQAAIAGAASENDDDSAKTWADQIMQAKSTISTCKSEQTQHTTKVQLLSKELAERKAELASLGAKSSKLQREYDDVKAQVVSSQKALEKLNFNDDIERKLLAEKKAVQSEISLCREQISSLSARLSRLKFNYVDPTPNFDRSSVKGVVAQLIEMKNAERDCVALEVAAGARLYNVVVDNEETASLLLKKGKLQHRVTIIPIDSIDARSIAPEKVRKAEKLVGKENVHTALSLVGSKGELEAAMKFVFGNCFVCPNMECAKEVTQDREISVRSVTLDGEVFDPQGTLTGGSRSKATPILKELTLLKAAKEKLIGLEGKLNEIDEQLRSSKRFHELKEVHQLKQHEMELLEQRLAQTPTHQLQSKIHSIEQSIEESKELIKSLGIKEKEVTAKVKELEKQSNDSESFREGQLKSLEAAITAAKASAANAVKLAKKSQQKHETLLLEIDELKNEIRSNQENISEISGRIEKWSEECGQLEGKISELDEEFNNKKREMEGKKNKLQKANEELRGLTSKKDDLQKTINEIGLTVQKSEYSLNKSVKDQADSKSHLAHLIAKFPWIPDDKPYFGKEGTEYDFKKIDPRQAQKRLAKLEEDQSKLSKSINRKVMNMFETAQKEYDDLKEKIEILLTNKKTIEDFIEDLEEKKIEALNITWAKVNTDFASIFSALLPGWTAKLEPPEGGTLTDGLRILFARDGVWKESLSELSGGQRSLLALSLILALLRVKPAPVYILDEVDSALDLSNTQNIGKMLKTHFSQSQFLVVSLKEGMWNNANVLFRTKFVEGVSTVTRTTPKQQAKTK